MDEEKKMIEEFLEEHMDKIDGEMLRRFLKKTPYLGGKRRKSHLEKKERKMISLMVINDLLGELGEDLSSKEIAQMIRHAPPRNIKSAINTYMEKLGVPGYSRIERWTESFLTNEVKKTGNLPSVYDVFITTFPNFSTKFHSKKLR